MGSGEGRTGSVLDGWVFWSVLALLGVLVVAEYTLVKTLFVGGLDLRVYRAGGYALAHGVPLYSTTPPVGWDALARRLPFTYPPTSALFFVPLGLMSFEWAHVLHYLVSVVAITLTCVVVGRQRLASGRAVLLWALAATALGYALEPVRDTLNYGQINLVLLAVVVLDCLHHRIRWLPRGLLTGVAAAVKLTPAVFVLYFAARRDWRASATVLATFVALTVVGLVVAPEDTRQFWLGALLHTDRIGQVSDPYNQSLQGALARAGVTGAARSVCWLVGALGVVLLGYLAAVRSVRAGDDLGALLAVAVVGLVASPISWDHHFVWVLLALLVLLTARTWRARVAVALAAAVFVYPPQLVWPGLDHGPTTWWHHLTGNAYLWIGVLLLGFLARRRPARDDAAAGQPAGSSSNSTTWRTSTSIVSNRSA